MVRARARWLGLTLWLAACGNSVDQTAVRFAVYSDVPLTRLDAVVLDEQGMPTTRANTFAIVPGSNAATSYLASVVIERTAASHSRSFAQVRFDGFIDGSDGPKAVVRRTVHAPFSDRQTRLGRVWLARSCGAAYGEDPSCPTPGFSCDYTTGACAPESILTLEDYTPETDERARWSPPNYQSCGQSDGACPARCTVTEDSDCRYKNGATCHQAAECLSGVCARACTDPACTEMRCAANACGDACTLVDLQGTCQHFVFDQDPLNCGSCGVACSDNHSMPQCQGGRCLKSCSPGFEDCNNNVQLDGCETDLTTSAEHCGGCSMPGQGCHYGVCEDSKCLGTVVGAEPPIGEHTMPAGQLFLKFMPIVVPSVVALGVHVSDGSVGKVTLLLLDAQPNSEPGTILVAQEVALQNSSTNARGEFFGTELRLDPPKSVGSGPFWLGFVFAQATTVKVMNRPAYADRRTSTDLITTKLEVGAPPPPLTALDTREAAKASDPLLYAVYFKR